MSGLVSRWRQVMAQYRQIKTPADDFFDIVSALLFTLGTLALVLGVAALIGGSHG